MSNSNKIKGISRRVFLKRHGGWCAGRRGCGAVRRLRVDDGKTGMSALRTNVGCIFCRLAGGRGVRTECSDGRRRGLREGADRGF